LAVLRILTVVVSRCFTNANPFASTHNKSHRILNCITIFKNSVIIREKNADYQGALIYL